MDPTNANARQLSALEALELARIPPEGLAYDEPVPPEWIKDTIKPLKGAPPETAHTVRGAGRIELVVMPLGPIEARPPLQLTGQLLTPLDVPCVRCLETVSLEQKQVVDVVVFPSSEEMEEAPESTYEGEKIDLGDVLREQLLLHLDPDPCCPDTSGCDTRTQALLHDANQAATDAENQGDPRWAALAELQTED